MPEKERQKNMVLIPGSEFRIGAERGGRLISPGQTLMVLGYYMDIYPVTNDEYGSVISSHKIDPAEKGHPVTGLSYDEILEYCRLTGKRLPTEAEWEKAARGNRDRRVYPWGDNFSSKKCNCRRLFFLLKQRIKPVTAYEDGKSPYGCVDMVGNVWEWTATAAGEEKYILKGGSCTSPSKKYLAVYSRLIAHRRCINENFGFRCCLSAP